MALEDLLTGLNPYGQTYSMMSDPIYGPLFAGMTNGQPTRGGAGGRGGAMGNPGPGSNWEQVARRMAMNRYDYTPEEWKKLDYIIERESGWNPKAVNEGSGAYGIPQILPSAHPDVDLQNDPMGQLRWLFRYIQQRYGGANQAAQFKQTHGWY
jgi:hypothetical protein